MTQSLFKRTFVNSFVAILFQAFYYQYKLISRTKF